MSAPSSDFDPRLEPAGASDESIQRVHAGLLHNRPEPEPGGYSMMPLLLLGFMSGLILACCIFFVHNRGGFDSLVYDGHIDPDAAKNAPVVLTLDQQIKRGQTLYALSCTQCHQATGLGAPGAYPALAGSDILQGNEERLVRIVLDGLAGHIVLNGQGADFPNKMPAFTPGVGEGKFNYSDAKISYVLTYVRQAFGNTASPISEEQVTAVHNEAAVASRKIEWTFPELPADKAGTPTAK